MNKDKQERQKLLLDNGEIRRCPKNFAILGYWKTWWMFFGYGRSFNDHDFEKVPEALHIIFWNIIYIIIFPLVPFIHAFACWRNAVRDAKRRERNKGDYHE